MYIPEYKMTWEEKHLQKDDFLGAILFPNLKTVLK